MCGDFLSPAQNGRGALQTAFVVRSTGTREADSSEQSRSDGCKCAHNTRRIRHTAAQVDSHPPQPPRDRISSDMRLKLSPRFALTAVMLASALAHSQEVQTSATAPKLEFVSQETVSISPAVQVGETPLRSRTMIPITGGTFSGPQIKGTIVAGGWDWQLRSKNGCTGVRADYMLRTDDASQSTC
jgi:Protein of unknown function (DUF3237)